MVQGLAAPKLSEEIIHGGPSEREVTVAIISATARSNARSSAPAAESLPAEPSASPLRCLGAIRRAHSHDRSVTAAPARLLGGRYEDRRDGESSNDCERIWK